ncbi:MAG: radical SAM family heme chaperone HemW [Candidatus Dadabacteria bacterium]|nr:radical SAM family heme chaperone HemW [Candidatus Dadabacteria bacterium]
MSFGIYIHIPYCVTKCPYCDFNSYGVGGRFPEKEYTESILHELEFYRSEIQGARLSSIFFGGGTPSLFDPRSIEKIISKIYQITCPVDNLEVSLEVNPKTADLEKLKGLRSAGINRISVGIQSFSKRKLSFLGRINAPEDSRGILKDIINAGFKNYSMDLMYGTKDETLSEWEADLKEALGFDFPHISAYCLTIEDGTEFGKRYALGKLKLPTDEKLADFIIYTTEFFEDAGYRQYEISNYSKHGFECRHNMLYWRGESYLGLGAGAHSHSAMGNSSLWGKRWANLRNPALYMKTVNEEKKPLDFTEELKREEVIEDKVLMGLRLKDGINILELESTFQLKANMDKVGHLVRDGFLEYSDSSIRLTKKGNLLSNAVILRFVEALN